MQQNSFNPSMFCCKHSLSLCLCCGGVVFFSWLRLLVVVTYLKESKERRRRVAQKAATKEPAEISSVSKGMKWSERKLERSTFFKADFMLFFNDCLIFSIPFRICSCGRIVTVKWHFGEHENPLYYVLYSSFRCYQGACSHNDSSKNSNLHNKVEFF